MTGTWTRLVNTPAFRVGTMLLLTDGTVMCHQDDTADWWKLAPDQYGSYVNATWSKLATGPNSPMYFPSAVMRDGRVFVAGGEYNGGAQVDLLAAEIYDSVSDTWSNIPTPPGWTKIGDAPCCVLPDGTIILGSISNTNTAIYDPVTNTWANAANKDDSSSEETWTLLADGTVLTAEVNNHPKTEKYLPTASKWTTAGTTPVDLVGASEIGPAILLPDGRVFAIGATSHTAIYTPPPIASQQGSWIAGPDFPAQDPGQPLGAEDAPACLLPNGRVLCVAGPISTPYSLPTYFFEFDPAALSFNRVADPPNSSCPTYVGRMLLLPTGQVLFANGSTDIEVYTPDGMPQLCWRPRIAHSPTWLQPNDSYELSGVQLNGLSQAVSYGDDASMATNYPIVRIRNLSTGKVAYCRTTNHSTMGVATGSTVQFTKFTVPSAIDLGASDLCVIANGISSPCISVTIN